MIFSLKPALLLATIAIVGLSAGLFYAWSVSVIPGTKKLPDLTYLQTMQSINKAILNPAFFLVFMGSIVLLVLSIWQYYPNKTAFLLLLAAGLFYLVGTFGVTALGNVPLNNALEALNLTDMDAKGWAAFRQHYEVKWNKLHTIRTVNAVIAFLLALLAAFAHTKTLKVF